MFGIKISCWFLWLFVFLSTILALTNACKAGVSTGLSPLPKDPQFQQQKSQTIKLLTALLYENNQQYQKSGKLWRTISSKGTRVQDHIFYNDLVSYLTNQPSEIPNTDKSKLLMSRLLGWQRKWQQALDTLEGKTGHSNSIENNLEAIRLNLVLGHYENTRKLIGNIGTLTHRQQMQMEIYTIWLQILEGNRKDALLKIAKLEENFLYLPFSTMFPIDYLGEGKKLQLTLNESLRRFPSNSEIFEQMTEFLIKDQQWEALDELVISQKYINGNRVDWNLLAEIYLNTGQYKQLEKVIKSKAARYVAPQYFDVLARFAMSRKNWELLFQVSKSYRSLFPELKDGLLYQAIYYQEIGRRRESEALIKLAGLQD